MNHEFSETIALLYANQKEGEYWDFKERHHENTADLVHDVICLANAVHHKGPRYLIYGIQDKTWEVVGVANDPKRRKQADIIDTLRSARFAGGEFPNVRLEVVQLKSHELDVLIIDDLPRKPYFLEQRKQEGKTTLAAGAVYTRNQDTNTPKDRTASAADLEAMWRQRFGLDLTPLERMELYIQDVEGWEKTSTDNESVYYYKKHPEFRIINHYEACLESYDFEWTKVFPNKRHSPHDVYFNYHNTVLKRLLFLWCNGGKFFVPAPEETFYEDGTVDYYYEEDTLGYYALNFFIKELDQIEMNFLVLSKIKVYTSGLS